MMVAPAAPRLTLAADTRSVRLPTSLRRCPLHETTILIAERAAPMASGGFWDQVIVAGIGIAAGALGYLAVTFWFRPILRFIDARHAVISDLEFYANAVDFEGDDKIMQARVLDRKVTQRRDAVELSVCYLGLPSWCRRILSWQGWDVPDATGSLIGLSNTRDWAIADDKLQKIRKGLKLPPYIG